MCRDNKKDFLKNLPINYPLGIVYLNGVPVRVSTFLNQNHETGLAYFMDEDGQAVVIDIAKIDGIGFGEADAE
ncbi:hypothetical protein [Peribacillus glennii]|uniref:Uncharacterized protein n=1 Tax=Peribacillus glennii TaxID=2303991 RepID=A0A372L9G2_9BACI|nr:hypothetical protein [Peribacillus glennii]RFU61749.1 hypothetical protein D0466_16535 [Peribacillus glennii]